MGCASYRKVVVSEPRITLVLGNAAISAGCRIKLCRERRRPDGLRLGGRGAEEAERAEQQRKREEEKREAGAGAPGKGVRPCGGCRSGWGRIVRAGQAPGAHHAAGRWPLAAGRWPLAAGRWPLAAGRWPLAAGRWPLANYTRAKRTPVSSAIAQAVRTGPGQRAQLSRELFPMSRARHTLPKKRFPTLATWQTLLKPRPRRADPVDCALRPDPPHADASRQRTHPPSV